MAMISPYQAFPITRYTVTGTLTDQPLSGTQRILHANADLDVTLDFPDGSTVTVSILGGMDVVLDGGATTVTTTASAILS